MTRLGTVLAAVAAFAVIAVGCGDEPLPGGTLPPPDTLIQSADAGADLALPAAKDSGSELDLRAAPDLHDAGADVPTCKPMGPTCGTLTSLGNPTQSKSAFPLVLVHGMGGFAKLGPVDYFVGVPKDLRERGFQVFVTVTDALNGSDVRAGQLAAQVDHILACTCSARVNLIGHSQGGIDARVLVDQLGYGDRVASVTTIASPHHGTPMADQLLALAPTASDPLIDFIAGLVTSVYTHPLQDPNFRAALTWCSAAGMSAFEKAHPADPRTRWYSYGGRAGLLNAGGPLCEGAELPNPTEHVAVSAAMLAGFTALGGLKGVPNDGLVTIEGARYGHFRRCLPADHMLQIGLAAGSAVGLYDHLALYREIALHIADEGF